MRWALVTLLLGAVALLCWFAGRAGSVAFGMPRAYHAADTPLAGSGGRPVRLARGPRVVVFGYVGCAERCPLTLHVLTDAGAPRVTFVDVDPWNDSPGRVARFVRRFDGVEAATGDLRALVANEAAFGMRPVTRAADVAGHDARVFVIDERGALVGTLDPGTAADEARTRLHAMVGSAPAAVERTP